MRKLMMAVALLATAGTALANVAETKAKAASQAKLDAAVAEAKTACGSSLAGEFAWGDYDKLPDKDRDIQVRSAGNYGETAVEDLAFLCKDKDYKPEVAKITKIVGHPGGEGSFFHFTKSGSTIDVHFAGGNAGNARDDLKKLF